MGNWMDDERVMICCCSDGTRPVIFKIERIDYKVLYIDGLNNENDKEKIKEALFGFNDVIDVEFKEDFTELIVDKDIEDKLLINLINGEGDYSLSKID